MRFQVPQFVDIEDKIIGPLTLKQFLIYIFAAMALVPVYLVADISLFITIALPILAAAALFAHFKVNGKPLEIVVMNAFRFYTQGQLFVWRRTGNEPLITIKDTEWEREIGTTNSGPSLNDMARGLETGGKVVSEDVEDIYAKT